MFLVVNKFNLEWEKNLMSLYYRKYALCNLRTSIPTEKILCVISVLIRVALRVYWYLQDSLSTAWILVVLFLKHLSCVSSFSSSYCQ